MFCKGRKATDTLPEIPLYYTYGSELIFHFEHQDGDVHKVISPRSNWYDYEMGMARIDYKPLDLEHDHHGGDPFATRQGVQTDIQDFIGGISYQIDQNFGNCSIVPIEEDLVGGITMHNGRIPISDPMYIFHTEDMKFAYNGEVSGRYSEPNINILLYICFSFMREIFLWAFLRLNVPLRQVEKVSCQEASENYFISV